MVLQFPGIRTVTSDDELWSEEAGRFMKLVIVNQTGFNLGAKNYKTGFSSLGEFVLRSSLEKQATGYDMSGTVFVARCKMAKLPW